MEKKGPDSRAILAGMADLPSPPWRITDTGSAFKISDSRGRSIAWIYYRREDALRSEYMSQDEAREVAKAVARLSKPLA